MVREGWKWSLVIRSGAWGLEVVLGDYKKYIGIEVGVQRLGVVYEDWKWCLEIGKDTWVLDVVNKEQN